MGTKAVSGIMLTLLLTSMLTLAFNIHPVSASLTIYVRADGSVKPSSAPISTLDNVTYTFTSDIYGVMDIVVERSHIIIDGNRCTLKGYPGLHGKGQYGFKLERVSNVTIKNTHITGFHYGVVIDSASNNTLCRNNITDCYDEGVIILGSSKYNTLYRNRITWNYVPASGVTIWSPFNNVSENYIANNNIGVRLSGFNNTFSGNVIEDNTYYNLIVDGTRLNHFVQSIDASNLVNGKPVHYLVNQNDLVITPATYPEIGYLALISCTNMIVEDLTLKNNGPGLLLANTNNSRITGNNIANNYDGVFLFSSFNNSFSGNNIMNSRFFGVLLYMSSNNRLCHNNFIDNYWQVGTFAGEANFWDNSYPSGGNYWSDYTGEDAKSGPYQNETGCDGIGDKLYTIDADNKDNYPLMNPYVPFFGDLNDDRQIDIRDIATAALAFGSYPNHPRWNPIADINQDNKVDIRDIASIAKRFGKEY